MKAIMTQQNLTDLTTSLNWISISLLPNGRGSRPYQTNIKALYFGAGTVGREMAYRLVKGQNGRTGPVSILDTANPLTLSAGPESSADTQDVIFLVGSIGDPDFFKARQTVIEFRPALLITLAITGLQEIGAKSIIKPDIDKNECWINVCQRDPLTAEKIIMDLYSSLAINGLICLDIDYVSGLLAGRICQFSIFECEAIDHVTEFGNFVRQQVQRLYAAKKLYCVFSYDYRLNLPVVDPYTSNFAAIMNAVSDRNDVEIECAIDWIRELDPGFRATIIFSSCTA